MGGEKTYATRILQATPLFAVRWNDHRSECGDNERDCGIRTNARKRPRFCGVSNADPVSVLLCLPIDIYATTSLIHVADWFYIWSLRCVGKGRNGTRFYTITATNQSSLRMTGMKLNPLHSGLMVVAGGSCVHASQYSFNYSMRGVKRVKGAWSVLIVLRRMVCQWEK